MTVVADRENLSRFLPWGEKTYKYQAGTGPLAAFQYYSAYQFLIYSLIYK